MKLTKLAAGSALAFGVLFLQSPAFSQFDGKTIPGAACDRVSGGTYEQWFGTVLNSSTTSELILTCPLVKMKKLTPGAEWHNETTNVQVIDRNTTLNVSCTRRSEYYSGSSLFLDEDTAATSGSSSNLANLTFLETDAVYDYDYVQCTIPRSQSGNRSHLVGVRYLDLGE